MIILKEKLLQFHNVALSLYLNSNMIILKEVIYNAKADFPTPFKFQYDNT